MRFSMSYLPTLIRSVLLLLALSYTQLTLAAPLLVSSIRPLHLITQELAGEHAQTELLLPASVSPHLYQLKPSDRLLLQQADRVFWIGPELERFLVKPLALLSPSQPMALLHTQGIKMIGGDQQDEHGHEGHDHQGIDPHIWLNVDNVRVIAQRISAELMAIDPTHRVQYTENLRRFIDKLALVDQQAASRLLPLKGQGYVLLHDGYSHFEQRYGLRRLAAFSLSPDRKPGARHLLAMRHLLDSGSVVCVFSEPQYQPAVLASIVGDRPIKQGLVDPLASQAIDYADFYQQFWQSFERCLSASAE